MPYSRHACCGLHLAAHGALLLPTNGSWLLSRAERVCRAMGESNAARQREPYLRRTVWQAAVAKYGEMFGSPEGTFPATFQVGVVGKRGAALFGLLPQPCAAP